MGPPLPLCVNNFGWLFRESLKHDWRRSPIRQSVGRYLWPFLDLQLVYCRYKTNACDFSNIIKEFSCLVVSVWSLPFKSVFRFCTFKMFMYYAVFSPTHIISQYPTVYLGNVRMIEWSYIRVSKHYKLMLLWMDDKYG